MLSLPEDITSFTKKGRKGYYTFLSYISFSFLFLLDKRYILSKAFHAITESHLGQQGVLDMKKVLFNSFFTFSDTKLPLHRNQKVRLLRHEVREGELCLILHRVHSSFLTRRRGDAS